MSAAHQRITGGAARLQSMLAQVGGALEILIIWAASVLLVLLASILFAQVVYRYVLQSPLSWSEEAARLMLVWFGLLAAAAGARSGQHFILRWLTSALPHRIRFWVRQIATVLTLSVVGVLFYQGIQYLSVAANQTSVMLGVDMRLIYLSVPFSLGLFFILQFIELLDAALSTVTSVSNSTREAREALIQEQLKNK